MADETVNRSVTVASTAAVLPGYFPGDLGIEVVEIEDEVTRGRLIVDQRHLHPGGYVHGGVWVALADTVAAWGTRRNLAAGENFTTSELKMNVFAAGKAGDELMAEARPLHRGRRTQVWEVRVSRAGTLAANFICTQMVLGAR